MSTDWKNVVATVAPQLATLLGGPLAGMAVTAIGSKLLGKPSATVAEVQTAVLSASPADLVKLKEVEADVAKTFEDSGVQLEQIAAGDRANARAMRATLKDWTPTLLAAAVVVGWTYLTVALRVNSETANSALMLVLSFYFGSSASSRVKDDTMNALSKFK